MHGDGVGVTSREDDNMVPEKSRAVDEVGSDSRLDCDRVCMQV